MAGSKKSAFLSFVLPVIKKSSKFSRAVSGITKFSLLLCMALLLGACGAGAGKDGGDASGGDAFKNWLNVFGKDASRDEGDMSGKERADVSGKDDAEGGASLQGASTDEEQGIQMVDFVNAMHLKSWVSEYNAKHPNAKIAQNISTESQEDLWNAVMAQLATGKGPDLFCMWPGDERIRTLYDKGLLANLDEYVPLEIKEQIFPGILQSGCVEQDWVGLGVEGMPLVYLTADKLWDKENWSVEEIVSLAQAHPELEGLFVNLDFTYVGESDPAINAECLFRNPYAFYDVKEKTSRFESKTFTDALEIIRQSKTLSLPKNNVADLLREGRILGVRTRLYSTQDYVDVMNDYCCDGCRFVGGIGQKDWVGNWSSVYLVLINRNTKHADAIHEFIEGLLDYNKQDGMSMSVSVREDVIRGKVRWADWSEQWEYNLGTKSFIPFTDPDGESYLEPFIAFLKKLGPCEEKRGPVEEIVLEEVRTFLQSQNGKSAEETARTIDNRVRLYLLENEE